MRLLLQRLTFSLFFCFMQKTAYEMRISDWSSDVCSSDLWGPDYQDPHTNADTFARNPDNSDEAQSKPLAWRNAWDIPEMTKMADAAALERDSAKRAEMYLELQKVHQATSPFVIMFQQIEVAAVRADTKGFIIGPSFDDNL